MIDKPKCDTCRYQHLEDITQQVAGTICELCLDSNFTQWHPKDKETYYLLKTAYSGWTFFIAYNSRFLVDKHIEEFKLNSTDYEIIEVKQT